MKLCTGSHAVDVRRRPTRTHVLILTHTRTLAQLLFRHVLKALQYPEEPMESPHYSTCVCLSIYVESVCVGSLHSFLSLFGIRQ